MVQSGNRCIHKEQYTAIGWPGSLCLPPPPLSTPREGAGYVTEYSTASSYYSMHFGTSILLCLDLGSGIHVIVNSVCSGVVTLPQFNPAMD